MSWILHDRTGRAVIASFPTRIEAETWRDRNGLTNLLAVSPARGLVPQRPACEARVHRADEHDARRRARRRSPR